MTTVNIFERASREDLRFDSPRGELTVSQLWQLPLTSTVENKPNLDGIARSVNKTLKSITEDSFVNTTPDPRRDTLTLQLDILKHIITTKMEENAASLAAANKKSEMARLQAILAKKKDEQTEGLSVEELEARIAALSS
jgi:uncharacterized small protein (DUF1192 family)